jgi:glycerophosphoryl diester phosphodiesterase
MMVMNLAHRGASEYAPENTLAAFYQAVEMGADGIETDLKLTKDGVIVLFHDKELGRTTNGSGPLSDYTWDELAKLDAGSWFSAVYTGERLITFEQFLHFFGRKKMLFALELKDKGIERQTLDMIDRFGVRDRVTVTSFAFDNLKAMRQADDSIKIGHLLRKIDLPAIKLLKEIGAQQICPAADQVTPSDVELAKAHGLEVRAWGVGSEKLMLHALSCGVDGMTINFPDKLSQHLKAE